MTNFQYQDPRFYGLLSLCFLILTLGIGADEVKPAAKSKEALVALIEKHPDRPDLHLDMAAMCADARELPQTMYHLSEAATYGATLRQIILRDEISNLLDWETQKKGMGGTFEEFLNDSFGSECATKMREEVKAGATQGGRIFVVSVSIADEDKTSPASKLNEATGRLRELIFDNTLDMLQSERTAIWADHDKWESDLRKRLSVPEQIAAVEKEIIEIQRLLDQLPKK